ncbi:MAG: GNAT family N-acetyltransferase [Halobacteriaceae archaeon]
MYVRGAKNREEVWLLDKLDELGLQDPAFRSRDYVVALDETTGEKAGFGRIRLHKNDTTVCEFMAIGVLEEWRGQGVGAHIVERLVELARDQGFEFGYILTTEGGYFSQFGFNAISVEELPDQLRPRYEDVKEHKGDDAIPMRLKLSDFSFPERFREEFKQAGSEETPEDDEEEPEDFGIDTDSATYKYDTGE